MPRRWRADGIPGPYQAQQFNRAISTEEPVNNITATPDDDGSVTVHFGGCDDDRPNCIPIMDGWNYAVRMYRPRAEILDRSWTFPAIASPGV
jgi:hypothetical protein